MSILNKIWRARWVLRTIIPSIIFNLSKLPLKQAVHLPILLYKPKLANNTGRIVINGPIKFGMIRLGINVVGIYPNSGIILENSGKLIFNGETIIGNDSAISIGNTGVLELGENFTATAALKLVCFHSVSTERNVLIGWNNTIMDTDFHQLTNVNNGGGNKPYGAIHIGSDVWIGNSCKLYKNTHIPHLCVVGSDTILHGKIEAEPYSLIINHRDITVKITNMYLNHDNDDVRYEKR